VTVLGGSSLTGVVGELACLHEGDESLVYGGSGVLARQTREGAPADVFASADEATMDVVVDAGLIDGEPRRFASNTLRVVVPAGNPGGIRTLDDLADPDRAVVLCAVEVPCGAAAHRLLDLEGVSVSPASEEQNVQAVLAKVRAGEADAGLVYATDALSAGGEVEAFAPSRADEVVNHSPVATLADAPNPGAAAAFVAFVTGDEGRAVLSARGFGAP